METNSSRNTPPLSTLNQTQLSAVTQDYFDWITSFSYCAFRRALDTENGYFEGVAKQIGVPRTNLCDEEIYLTFMQTRDGDAEVFSWTTTLERQAAIEGAFLYTNVVLNIAAVEALTYTFDAQWSGLSTGGNPYYLATAQGPGYITFLEENHIVPLQSHMFIASAYAGAYML